MHNRDDSRRKDKAGTQKFRCVPPIVYMRPRTTREDPEPRSPKAEQKPARKLTRAGSRFAEPRQSSDGPRNADPIRQIQLACDRHAPQRAPNAIATPSSQQTAATRGVRRPRRGREAPRGRGRGARGATIGPRNLEPVKYGPCQTAFIHSQRTTKARYHTQAQNEARFTTNRRYAVLYLTEPRTRSE